MAVDKMKKVVNGEDLEEFGKLAKKYHDENNSGEALTTKEVDDICVDVFKMIIPDKTDITISLAAATTEIITTNPTGCTFTSLDTAIATVDSSTGEVTAVAQGDTEIKISLSGYTDTYVKVTITA